MTYWLAGVVHNCIVHPLMSFLPKSWGDALHDWTLQYWPPMDEAEEQPC